MKNQTDVYDRITASIIEAIEAGCGKFEMPWHSFGMLPSNASNNRRYRGINILVLWAAASQRGYKTQLWATYQQWRELGAQVLQGEKSTAVVFWKFYGEDGEADSDSPMNKAQRIQSDVALLARITCSTPIKWKDSPFPKCRRYRKRSVFKEQRVSSATRERESSRPACARTTIRRQMKFICRPFHYSRKPITFIPYLRMKQFTPAGTFHSLYRIRSMKHQRIRQVLLGVIGLLYLGLLYPLFTNLWHSKCLVHNKECEPMFITLFVALGFFLVLAARKP